MILQTYNEICKPEVAFFVIERRHLQYDPLESKFLTSGKASDVKMS